VEVQIRIKNNSGNGPKNVNVKMKVEVVDEVADKKRINNLSATKKVKVVDMTNTSAVTVAAPAVIAAPITNNGKANLIASLVIRLKKYAADLDLEAMSTLDMSHWRGFGMKNSHVYRDKLEKAFAEEGLNDSERFMVHAFAVAIKNKKRVLDSMDVFESESWYSKTRKFYDSRVVQYTREENSKLFALIHIPSCHPSLSMFIWTL
jgi:hypothetical protein